MVEKQKRTREQRQNAILRDVDIVIFKEKHGKFYMSLVPDDERDPRTKSELWDEICFAVATERIQDGFWYPTEEPRSTPRPVSVDPNAPTRLQKEQIADIERWQYNERYVAETMIDWNLVQRVQAGDKQAAVKLIERRGDNEYEGYDFAHFTHPSELFNSEVSGEDDE